MFVQLLYIVAAVLFIFGLKGLTHPRTAVRGNLLGAAGMLLAIVVTLTHDDISGTTVGYVLIVAGLLIGTVVGTVMAQKVEMTQMPQLVALLNGFGGAASVLVAGAELLRPEPGIPFDKIALAAAAATGIIGAVTFFGSLIAFGKLQELQWFRKPVSFPGAQAANAALVAVTLLLSVFLVAGEHLWLYILIVLFASVLGVTLTNPIGGADMPVVIALLNSYSGLAAAATGFVIDNNLLIITGSLVGASGIILTQIMCKAMNRSLTNVLFAKFEASSAANANEVYANVKATSPDDVAMMLDGVQRVVFVPGYGMAVAQAQHAVRDLTNLLEKRGTTVEFAIHPVAGRMPGHMNVLLAEADIPYDKLREMDDINPTLETVDVAIVIGANDVVNPVARTDPKSPIAGMPIIDIDKCRFVIVIKRSLSPGFAGIPNPLFAMDNTRMLYGDGKDAVMEIVKAMKEG